MNANTRSPSVAYVSNRTERHRLARISQRRVPAHEIDRLERRFEAEVNAHGGSADAVIGRLLEELGS